METPTRGTGRELVGIEISVSPSRSKDVCGVIYLSQSQSLQAGRPYNGDASQRYDDAVNLFEHFASNEQRYHLCCIAATTCHTMRLYRKQLHVAQSMRAYSFCCSPERLASTSPFAYPIRENAQTIRARQTFRRKMQRFLLLAIRNAVREIVRD